MSHDPLGSDIVASAYSKLEAPLHSIEVYFLNQSNHRYAFIPSLSLDFLNERNSVEIYGWSSQADQKEHPPPINTITGNVREKMDAWHALL
jgi:hypothetical protein